MHCSSSFTINSQTKHAMHCSSRFTINSQTKHAMHCSSSFTMNSQTNMQCAVLQTFTKQKLLQNLKRIHGGLFELEILEIF